MPLKALFSKPGFANWLAIVGLVLLVYFKFAAALTVAVTMAVVCRPLYETLLRSFSRPLFLKARSTLAHELASVFTQIAAGTFVLICVLAPLWVLSQNRTVILNSALSVSAGAREWSRSHLQALGERMHIQEWDDFEVLPEAGDAQDSPSPGSSREPSMQNRIVDMVSHPGPFLPYALKTIGGGAMGLGQLMFFFMAMHFLLLHGPAFWQRVLQACPVAWRETFRFHGQRTKTVLMATCVVHGLTAVSAFLIALPVFWFILGSKHFILMAMLAGFFQFIPLLGSATLLSIMTVYFFATGSPIQGWECLLLAFPLVVAVPDLAIRPFLSERYGKIHSMTMLAGFITGIEVFGVLGFVLGPLIFDLLVQFTNQVLRRSVKSP